MNQHLRHPELIAAGKGVALSADRLRAIQTEAMRLAPFVAKGEIAKSDAVDTLCNVAEAHGLFRTARDREDIEHVIGQGLAGIETLEPTKTCPQPKAATNGHVGHLGATSGGPATIRLRCMSEIAPEPVHWLWPGRLAAGKVALLFGEPGIGKSQISFDIAARVTTGAKWPDGGEAPLGKVVILSSEDGLADTVRPRLDAAGAEVSHVHVVEAVKDAAGTGRTFNLAADLDALERAINELSDKVKLIIIDPITSYMGRIDSHRTTDVRRVLEPLAGFADRLGVAVLAVSHPPKSKPAKALNAITGSGAYAAFARSIFLVAEEAETGRRLLLPVKSSLTALPAGLGFHLEERTPGTGIKTSCVVWSSDPVTTTADEALAASGKAKSNVGAVAEAEDWLADLLDAGPISARDALAQAEAAGIAERTLGRAKKNLDVQVSKDGMGGGWRWNLPQVSPKTAKVAEGGQGR